MLTLVFISMLVLGSFMAAGVSCFGQLPSYSAYASKWGMISGAFNGPHLWSLVTFTAALLLVPPMIEAGAEDPLQFLGFFTPVYLIVVSFTPDWETDDRQRRMHEVSAIACALCNIVWVCLVCHLWWALIVIAGLVAMLASYQGTLSSCRIFWGEVIMFLSAYVSILKMLS